MLHDFEESFLWVEARGGTSEHNEISDATFPFFFRDKISAKKNSLNILRLYNELQVTL